MTGVRDDVDTPPTGQPLDLHRGRPVVAALVAGTWATMFCVVLAVGWLLTHPLSGSVGVVDNDLAQWLAAHRSPVWTAVAEVAQVPGNTITGQVVLLLVALAFSLWQRSAMPAVFVVLVDVGLTAVYLGVTALVPRDRPPVRILDPGLVPDHSFPSGHVATACAVCGSIVVLTWLYARTVAPWTLPLLVLPVCTLLARLYQGAHHLSDVLTALVYATMWIATITVVLRREHGTARTKGAAAP
jgi:membrane-associated phospholipid phosphatase